MNSVYLIKAENTKRYKIGTTQDVENRIKGIQTGCPYKLRLVKSISGDKYTEDRIHNKYNKYRVQGEWFEFDGRVKRNVMKYMNEVGVDGGIKDIIQLKEGKEHLLDGLKEGKESLQDLLTLSLINMELGCYEEARDNVKEFYIHLYGNFAPFVTEKRLDFKDINKLYNGGKND
jgi:hypothetical protein|tara:strand:+ start:60 stop:581 length:522 start_codon:yes stop_codon:yes gene_type:complete